jgi:hypothetical protein
MSLFMSTSTHNLELDLETNWYLGTYITQWQVSSLSIMGFHY